MKTPRTFKLALVALALLLIPRRSSANAPKHTNKHEHQQHK